METNLQTNHSIFQKNWSAYIYRLQDQICAALEAADGKVIFKEYKWLKEPSGKQGGGKTRVIANGNVFEKGGVNTSEVSGEITPAMKQALKLSLTAENGTWFACGLSLIIHPKNPFVPTVHANWRYFELFNQKGETIDCWFGGGSDLTPYYLFEEDARHFHQTLKNASDPFGTALYPVFKNQCDTYFNNAHRGFEMRGIGGVFYDHLRPGQPIEATHCQMDLQQLFNFQKANGDCFSNAYIPIVQKRKDTAFSAENKYWQEIRRGRYVEFNLIHDRGTIFGLKTGGRADSILLSLPPTVRFDYDFQPKKGSQEEKLLKACKSPVNWV